MATGAAAGTGSPAQSRAANKVTIAYDDGTRDAVSAKRVRARTRNPDTRIECHWAGVGAWYGGQITGIGKDATRRNIKYDDAEREGKTTGGCRTRGHTRPGGPVAKVQGWFQAGGSISPSR